MHRILQGYMETFNSTWGDATKVIFKNENAWENLRIHRNSWLNLGWILLSWGFKMIMHKRIQGHMETPDSVQGGFSWGEILKWKIHKKIQGHMESFDAIQGGISQIEIQIAMHRIINDTWKLLIQLVDSPKVIFGNEKGMGESKDTWKLWLHLEWIVPIWDLEFNAPKNPNIHRN